MPDTRAIIFDLDDTLYPERAYAFSGFDAVSSAFTTRLNAGFDLAARMRRLFDTPDRSRVFNAVVHQCNAPHPDALVAEMIDVFRRHHPRITLHPDADAALTRLKPSHKLGLITDGYAVTQHAKIDALELRPRVDAIIVTDDLGREFWKPHPRAFQEIADRLSVNPRHCTYVADNPAKDFVAPNALGWHTVLIHRPNAVHAQNPTAPTGAPRQTTTTLQSL